MIFEGKSRYLELRFEEYSKSLSLGLRSDACVREDPKVML